MISAKKRNQNQNGLAAAPAKKVVLPGEGAKKRVIKEPAAREHLAADERGAEPAPNGLGFTCLDCGEPITVAEHLRGQLCRRCDPEQAGRGNWQEVPEVEPPGEVPATNDHEAKLHASREAPKKRFAVGFGKQQCPRCTSELLYVQEQANGGTGYCYACEKILAERSGLSPPCGLSTVTPAGIAANDPEALPRSREDAKEEYPAPLPACVEPGKTFLCSFAELAGNRFNPRENFNPVELDELGERLKRDGQVQAVLVRKAPIGRDSLRSIGGVLPAVWEIVAGQRRAMAAFRAKLPGVRVEVIENCDDARACELAIAENRDRKDISQVEYARGLQKLADLKGLDPAGLAKDQQISEQHVRNLLRLLKTPPEWQQLVIDGKIDGTHLRTAAPFLHVPAIAKALAKELRGEAKPSLKEWEEIVRETAFEETEAIVDSTYGGAENGYRRIDYAIPESEHEALGLIEVENYDGKKEKRATNVKLAAKLLAKAEAEAKKKAAKKSDKKDAKAAKEKEELTPAERKKREAEQARKFQQRLENWFHDWLRVLCAAAIQPGGLSQHCEQGALWLTAFALWARPGNEYREREAVAELAAYKPKQYESDVVLKFLEPLDGTAAAALMHAYAPRMLVGENGSPRGPTSGQNPLIGDEVVAVLAREVLGLDVAAAWRDDRKSPMREKFWNLHSKDQLAALGEELGVYITSTSKKSQAVDVLLGVERPLKLPKELAKLVAPFEAPKKTSEKTAKVRKPR